MRDVPFSFPTFGDLSEERLAEMLRALKKERIDLVQLDAGDGSAGWIKLLIRSRAKKGKHVYQLAYNRNHPPATRFVTLAHELAHMFLGHLGEDRGRSIPDRSRQGHHVREAEAEMAAFLVAMRNGLKPRSETYLANFEGVLGGINLHVVMRGVNAIETALGIGAKHLWEQKDEGLGDGND